jgi:hypothetical protein
MSRGQNFRSGHAEEKSLAMYRDLALADVSTDYEASMQSFPANMNVRRLAKKALLARARRLRSTVLCHLPAAVDPSRMRTNDR